jgi:hypothetical protein
MHVGTVVVIAAEIVASVEVEDSVADLVAVGVVIPDAEDLEEDAISEIAMTLQFLMVLHGDCLSAICPTTQAKLLSFNSSMNRSSP